MKSLLLGCGMVVLLVLLGIGGCTYMAWKSVAALPPDAQREALFAKHKNLIDRLDAAIRGSADFASAAERIKSEAADLNIVYLKVAESGGAQQLEVIKRTSWESSSSTVWNGAGIGKLHTKFGTQDIRIVQSHERTTAGQQIEYTVYFAQGELEQSPVVPPAGIDPAMPK